MPYQSRGRHRELSRRQTSLCEGVLVKLDVALSVKESLPPGVLCVALLIVDVRQGLDTVQYHPMQWRTDIDGDLQIKYYATVRSKIYICL